jgi:hypothetical protein
MFVLPLVVQGDLYECLARPGLWLLVRINEGCHPDDPEGLWNAECFFDRSFNEPSNPACSEPESMGGQTEVLKAIEVSAI